MSPVTGKLPIVDSITFDAPTYAVGALVTCTLKYHDPDARTVNVTGVATDAESNASLPLVGSFKTSDPCNGGLSDDASHAWTVVSDDHVGTAVFTTHA